MFRKSSAIILLAVAPILISVFTVESAFGEYEYDDYRTGRYGNHQQHRRINDDKMISEKRQGAKVDDWIERGESSVTDSPEFKDGVRLAARANRNSDEYALASAIYFFEIPAKARSIKIKLQYEGEAGRGSSRNTAGRIWIKSASGIDGRRGDYRRSDRLEDTDQALRGDTFTLREGKRSEEIEISARDHIIDGIMELHVIAEGRQTIDLKHIEVKTYKNPSNVKVVKREYQDRIPERRYSGDVYRHFYSGPSYHSGDRHYVRRVYPKRRWVPARRRYRSGFSIGFRSPHFSVRYSKPYRFGGHPHRNRRRGPIRLRRWRPIREEIIWR